jgi:hypothetical protein
MMRISCGIALLFVLISMSGGCSVTSVVSKDKSKTRAIEHLADWHYAAAETPPSTMDAAQLEDYRKLFNRVESYVETKTEQGFGLAESMLGGTVDLSEKSLTTETILLAAKAFKRQPAPTGVTDEAIRLIEELIGKSRKDSAKGLATVLKSYRLPEPPPPATGPSPTTRPSANTGQSPSTALSRAR